MIRLLNQRRIRWRFATVVALVAWWGVVFSTMAYGKTESVRVQRDLMVQVSDEEGKPLPAISIVLENTSVKGSTDRDGRMLVRVPSGMSSGKLIISGVGYERKEVLFGADRMIRVTLRAGMSDLDEVVVVGFGTQKKISVTGAISSVDSKDLARSPNPNIANTLAGRATGVSTVQISGQPGGDDPLLFIRGLGSLSSEASLPLVLVDGVERPFSQLDPNEIESFSILKDASATAVFGVRGANGVIVITTKRGKTGKPTISFSATAGFEQPQRLPSFVDSYRHALLYNEAQLNDDPNAVLKFSEEAIEAFRTNSDPIIYPNTDFIGHVLKPSAFQNQQNVNISGGGESVRYFVSIGHTKQDGLFRIFDQPANTNFSYNRYNYRANIDIDVTKSTIASFTMGGRSEIRTEPLSEGPLWQNIYYAQPYRGIGFVDGKHIQSDPRYIPGEFRDALFGYFGRGYQRSARNPLSLDLNLEQKLDALTNGLAFRIKGSYNGSYTYSKVRTSTKALYRANYLHDLDPTAPDDKTVVYKKIGEDGILNYAENFDRARDWYFETALSYQRSFSSHNVSGLLLYNQSKTFYPSVFVDIPRGYVGLVGRATYDYKSKYLVDLNIGYNGSENFAPDRRFGLFPAASLGWVASEETFVKENLPFINFLKFRGSYGIVGNDRMGGSRFLYLPDSYIPNIGGYSFGVNIPQDQIGAAEGKVGNAMVTWEKSKKQNYGLEFEIFDGKLGFVGDYFTEHRNNILTTRQVVPGIVAIDLPAVNIGEVSNRGYELQVTWKDKIGAFNYRISPNMSFSRNKIIHMDEVPRSQPYLYRTGNRVNQPFGYVFDGYWTQDDVDDLSSFPNANYPAKPGDLRYKDLNGDGQINADDTRAIGFPDYPEYIFGLNLQMQFKGFDLHMLWTGATNVSRAFSGSFQIPFGPTHGFGLMEHLADGRWTPETAETATFPRFSFLGVENNTKVSDYWLRDASYVRLKNMELGYSFDASRGVFFKALGISSLRIFTNGFNLLTFDKLKIVDPESLPSAAVQYPLMRIYNFGLNVTF